MDIDEVKTRPVEREHATRSGKPGGVSGRRGWMQMVRDNPGLYIVTLIAFLLVSVVFACVLIYALTVIFDPAL